VANRPPWLKPPYDPPSVALGAFVTLTNVGSTYDAIGASKGLGFVRLDMTNVTSIVFTVRVNKVGTGTQDWQLWSDTDSVQIGVISDSGAAGDKELSTTINSLALTGVKQLRVRAKSSVAADDPQYYGACLVLG
jgi:hypothetical protein